MLLEKNAHGKKLHLKVATVKILRYALTSCFLIKQSIYIILKIK